MKWYGYIGCYLIFSVTQSVFATVPVTISNPSPAISSTYNIGSSNTVIYTITNNVPSLSFPIVVSGISNPITRIATTNDCGNALPAGPSTCNIGLLIAPTSSNAGSSLNQNLSVNYEGRIPLVKNITFSVPDFLPVTLIATGINNTGSLPLLAVSTNSGNTWEVETNIAGLPTAGMFAGAGCTGSGSTAICVAAGQDTTGSQPPLVAVSANAGNNWSVKAISNITTNGFFNAAGCSGSGASAICVVAGKDNTGSTPPLLAESIDGGNTWTGKSISGLVSDGVFDGVSCTGTGSSAICVAAGQDEAAVAPIMAVSTNGGSTWATPSIPGLPASGILASPSCIGTGSNAICIVGGEDYTGNAPPLLVASTDGGNTWSIQNIIGNPASGNINGTSCIGSGSNAICVAAGQDETGDSPPLVVTSTDGANTWGVKNIPGLPASGLFNGVSCTGNGSSALCVAVGQDSTGTTPPLLVVSSDGGNTWGVKNIPGLTTNGSFNSVSCSGSGSSASCVASGQDNTGTTPPLLVASVDGGNTWTVVNNIPNFPTNGDLFGTAATA